eukprot:scaffold70396_cov18-Prasinocladus_malaysianus.AAC.1
MQTRISSKEQRQMRACGKFEVGIVPITAPSHKRGGLQTAVHLSIFGCRPEHAEKVTLPLEVAVSSCDEQNITGNDTA